MARTDDDRTGAVLTGLPETAPPPETTVPPAGAATLPALDAPPGGGTQTPPVDVSAILAELERPDLVITEGYIGGERRADGLRGRLGRASFPHRRRLLRLELAVAAAVLLLAGTSFALVRADGHAGGTAGAPATSRNHTTTAPRIAGRPAPATSPHTPVATAPPATSAPSAPAPTAPPATQPTAAQPPPTKAPTAPPAAAPLAPTAAAAPTPDQLGAQALALVRYPWQQIPGYSIQFLPIADAPSPGFYGNTTFTWGQAGGTSTLYVYPGEATTTLAGIVAFEIGHEVDAAAVEPQGGHAAIENALGIHPASWAPNCDCAEQGFLSGWYAAAFSNQWSPGVGNWSTLAPEPTGATLTAVEPWLDPTIP